MSVIPPLVQDMNLGLVLAVSALAGVAISRSNRARALGRRVLETTEMELALREQAIDQHCMVTVSDRYGVILRANDRFAEVICNKGQSVEGLRISGIAAEHSRPLAAEMQRRTNGGAVWTGEMRLTRPDGSLMLAHCTMTPLIDAEGRHLKNLGLWVDVTNQRMSEAEQMMTAAFEKMSDTVFVYDPASLRLCYMNGFGLEQHGWTVDQFATKTYLDTICYDVHLDLAGQHERIIDESKTTLRVNTGADGKTYEAQSYSVAAPDGSARILVIARDVSQLANAERERAELVSVITHELRTPLTSIRGSIALLESGALGMVDQKLRGVLEIAGRNCVRMLNLIRDILEVEKLGQSGLTVASEPVIVCEAVRAAVEAHQGFAASMKVELVNTCKSNNELMISGDKGRLQQVLANLLSNATKFSPENSRVEIGATVRGDQVTIHVQDHGAGIPEEIQPQIFKRFSASGANSRGISGSGLGLNISKSLVEKMHGQIGFTTKAGKGTRFEVVFPVLSKDSGKLYHAA